MGGFSFRTDRSLQRDGKNKRATLIKLWIIIFITITLTKQTTALPFFSQKFPITELKIDYTKKLLVATYQNGEKEYFSLKTLKKVYNKQRHLKKEKHHKSIIPQGATVWDTTKDKKIVAYYIPDLNNPGYGTIYVKDITGKEILWYPLKEKVLKLRISAKGNALFYWIKEDKIKAIDLNTKTEIKNWNPPPIDQFKTFIINDKDIVIYLTNDKKLHLLNTSDFKDIILTKSPIFAFDVWEDYAICIVYTNKDTKLIWLKDPHKEIIIEGAAFYDKVIIDPLLRHAFTIKRGNLLVEWNLIRGKKSTIYLPQKPSAWCFSYDIAFIILGYPNGKVEIYQTYPLKLVKSLSFRLTPKESLTAIAEYNYHIFAGTDKGNIYTLSRY